MQRAASCIENSYTAAVERIDADRRLASR